MSLTMSTFRSINFMESSSAGGEKMNHQTSPLHEPNNASRQPPPPTTHTGNDDGAATPTRANFHIAARGAQRSVPRGSSPPAAAAPFKQSPRPQSPATTFEPQTPQRTVSTRSVQSSNNDDMDLDMSPNDGAGSDDSAVHSGDDSKKNKKQKTMFYCTGWPGCNLGFTRSEHLARHIRKHTGERPFQCHCKRLFSRLDNLRQHAQTVHQNEDIPPESLAASGARYHKSHGRSGSIRHGARNRSSIGGSVGARGHSKSLSTSSVSSIGTVQGGQEVRRRPPPLVMADPQARLSYESYRPDGQLPLPASPSDFGTPTSSTFSTGQDSPRYSISSPSHSYQARRLSVPTGANMFNMYAANNGPPHYLGSSAVMAGSTSGSYSPMNNGLISSPTISNVSGWSRRDSVGNRAPDDDFRRRTWHPDTLALHHRESRLSQVLTPSQIETPAPQPQPQPQPQSQQQSQAQQTVLPSVQTLFRMADAESASNRAPESMLQRRINDMDINRSPQRDGAGTWANETNQAVYAQADRARVLAAQPQPTVRFETGVESYGPPSNTNRGLSRHHHSMSAPSTNHNMVQGDTRRYAWHNGPVASRPPPETIHEGRAHIDRLEHPNLSHFSGFPARSNQPVVHQQLPVETNMDHRTPHENMNVDSRRLDVLVAAATSMENALTPRTPTSYRDLNGTRQSEARMGPDPENRALQGAPGQTQNDREHYEQSYRRCHWCRRANAAQWRHGPDGPGTLCDACGHEYVRQESARQQQTRI